MLDLRLDQIHQQYGSRKVIAGLDLEIESGSYLVLLGESGCGKTTTLRLIAGLERPSAGSIWIGGNRVDRLPPRQRDVSMVFQDDALYPHLTVRASIAFGLGGLAAEQRKQRIEEAADLAGARELLDRYPERLSGGELRRATIAKAIARRSRVRLMDEPLSALNPAVRQTLQDDLLKWHAAVAGTTVHVTHDGYEALRMADQIAVLDGGRIVQLARPDELYRFPATRAVALATGNPPINLLSGSDLSAGPGRLTWPSDEKDSPPLDATIDVGIRPESFRIVDEQATKTSTPGLLLDGTVERALPIEDRVRLTLHWREHSIVAVCPADRIPEAGQPCELFAPQQQLHLFDHATGRRRPLL